jgi:hypothetical protein
MLCQAAVKRAVAIQNRVLWRIVNGSAADSPALLAYDAQIELTKDGVRWVDYNRFHRLQEMALRWTSS